MRHVPVSYYIRLLALPAGLLVSAGPGRAQATSQADKKPTAPAASNSARTDVKPEASSPDATAVEDSITLTPFQVDASKDKGYYSANTLSGTRINSKVQDLGASITVINKQQLTDTAALDINDVFRYESNTEGIYNYTTTSAGSPTLDLIQGGSATSGGPAVSTRVRGISSPNIAIDNFTHTARIPFDTYNIDSIEISRGPNSTLFGLGSPSGTINTNLAPANLTKTSASVDFRADSVGGYRTSFNVNTPLWKDKLAIRVAALYSNNKFNQKPSYDLTKRQYAALLFKPFSGTTLTLKAEHYREERQAPNTLTPRDGITEWLNNGKPTWDPLTSTYTVNGVQSAVIPVGSGTTAELLKLPPGLFANATTYTRPTMYIDGGKVQLWEITRLNTAVNPSAATTSNVRMLSSGNLYMRGTTNSPLNQNIGISNKALYDWTSINAVPANWNYDSAAMYTAAFEQKIVENLYFRAAWHLEDSVEYNRNITNATGPTLLMDVNKNLVDGRPNPYYLRPYFQTIEPTTFRLPEYNDNLQAQLTYELNLTEKKGVLHWLGHHRMLGYYESRHITQGTFRFREAVIDPNHPWLTAGALNYTNGNAFGRPTYDFYVGPTNALGYTPGYSAPKSGVSGTFNVNYFNPTTNQWVSDPALFGDATYVTSQTRQEITSRGGVLQSDFFDNRIVFTGGIRKDFNRTRNSNGNIVDGTTGFYDNGALKTWLGWTPAEGLTRSVGVVVKPLPWFGFSYNKASSFLPQPPAVDLLGNVLPNTYGHGHDVGAFVNLLGDRLVLSVKFYKQDNTNDRTSNSTIGSRIARIDAGVYLPGTSADTFSLYNFASTVANQRLGTSAPADQLAAEIAKITQYPNGFKSAIAANISGTAIRGTANTEAKGGELELTYNPSQNWTIKLTAAKTEAINTTIENALGDYIAARMPYWTSVKDDQGNLWWDSTALGAQSAHAFFDASVGGQIKLDQALLGKSNPQIKKYTWRAITNYVLSTGTLKGLSFGGSVGWDDKSVIGFLGSAPDTDGIVRSLDVNKPIYDGARYNADLWTAYSIKDLFRGISARIQLNVQNITENGGLRPVGVNPDGSIYNYRIIDPRKYVLSTTFEF